MSAEMNPRSLRAIPTEYRGTMFRSRTEARWAYLMDLVGIRWEYEPEGFQLESVWYLPDFWLPKLNCFAEVKGIAEQWDGESMTKAEELAIASKKVVLMLDCFDEANQHVRALIPQFGPEGQTDIWRKWVNFLESARRRRAWYEEEDEALLKDPDPGWGNAVNLVRNHKFQ